MPSCACHQRVFVRRALQIGRKPPVFQPRDAASVTQRLEAVNAKKAKEHQLAAWAACHSGAASLTRAEKPSRETLLAGPCLDILHSLEVSDAIVCTTYCEAKLICPDAL